MSITPRKERSDEARRKLAQIHGLKSSATWSEIDVKQIDHAAFIKIAERYGLDENATWDDVYAGMLNKINEGKAVKKSARTALIAASPVMLLLFIWTNWVISVFAIAVFLVVLVAMFLGHGHENSEHVNHMLHHPEITERARRDGLFGLSDDN